jgi:hypothetical protein
MVRVIVKWSEGLPWLPVVGSDNGNGDLSIGFGESLVEWSQ